MNRETIVHLMDELMRLRCVANLDFNQDDNELLESFFTSFKKYIKSIGDNGFVTTDDDGTVSIVEGTYTLHIKTGVVLQYDNITLIVGERYAPIRDFIFQTFNSRES